jgi:hypothetical protein
LGTIPCSHGKLSLIPQTLSLELLTSTLRVAVNLEKLHPGIIPFYNFSINELVSWRYMVKRGAYARGLVMEFESAPSYWILNFLEAVVWLGEGAGK